VVDHRARASESVRVASCVSTATSAVGYADARSDAIVTYVRPTFESGPPDALRRRLLGLVSISVAPTVPVVRRARASCAGTRVLWFHRGAAATREDCLRLLDRDLAFLDRVTVDGLRAFEARSLPVGTCHGPAAT